MKYSIIIPVYNRPQEVEELLRSLVSQSHKDFEVIVVEDGSSERCEHIVNQFRAYFPIQYYYKQNTGPGDSRNFGMARARGEYLIFFDSDCIIPPEYFRRLDKFLSAHRTDAFGGPDSAHPSFSIIQKAINYAMTSFLTTGGIRGKKKNLDNYQPRSFNMGFTRKVFEEVGGFCDIHPGEDPDLSYRIMDKGFTIHLIEEAVVYHKRRINFRKFARQIFKFGVVRTVLLKWHPNKFKMIYLLPSAFLVGSLLLLLLAIVVSPWMVSPLLVLAAAVFGESLLRSRHVAIAAGAVIAAFVQLYSYGVGTIYGLWKLFVMKKEERQAFPEFFFKAGSKIEITK